MFIPWTSPAVRLTGRWSRLPKNVSDPHLFVQADSKCTCATAPGSSIEIAFQGRMALLAFDLSYRIQPFPHLWISVDGGAAMETPLDQFLRICCPEEGEHVIRILFKSSMEMQHRWHLPLTGMVAFAGLYADAPGTLSADTRPLIEFVGDSITEGVLIDVDYPGASDSILEQHKRNYQDDNAATYAALTAQRLNLRAMFQAYGAVGLTRSGCGGVPRAGLLYPYVFEGVPYTGEHPQLVVINHGANDRGASPEEYLMRYEEMLDLVHQLHPDAIIVCLSAFCGAFDGALGEFVETYRARHAHPVYFISSRGWVPPEPLHPLRDGHQIIADHLTPALRDILQKHGL